MLPGTSFSRLTTKEVYSRIAIHEAAIAHLKQTIAHHRRAIARYRGCLNEITSPINKLPLEVWSEIFVWCRISCQNGEEGRYGWLVLARVCRLWRNTVLTNPLLFSYINITTSPTLLLSDFLRFSTPAPLHIDSEDTYISTSQSRANWEKCIPHLPRTRILTLHREQCRGLRKLPVCPMLTSLTYQSSYLERISGFKEDLRNVAPNLRCLKTTAEILEKRWLSISSLPLTIKTLSLDYSTFSHALQQYGTTKGLIQALASLPVLENLQMLHMSLDDYQSPMDRSDLRVPPLNCLHLSGHSLMLRAIFHHVPSVKRFFIDIDESGGLEGRDEDRDPDIMGNRGSEEIMEISSMISERWRPIFADTTNQVEPPTIPVFDLCMFEGSLSCHLSLITDYPYRDDSAFPFTSIHAKLGFFDSSKLTFGGLYASLTKAMFPHPSPFTRAQLVLTGYSNNCWDTNEACRTVLDSVRDLTDLEVLPGYWVHAADRLFQADHLLSHAFPIYLEPSPSDTFPLPGLKHLGFKLHKMDIEDEDWIWAQVRNFFTRLIQRLHYRKLLSLKIDVSEFSRNNWYHPDNCILEVVAKLERVADEVVCIPPRGLQRK